MRIGLEEMWHKLAVVLSILSFASALRLNRGQTIQSKLGATVTQPSSPELGWDSHKAIDSIPETLVRTIDGNESMRRKFEELCRSSQV